MQIRSVGIDLGKTTFHLVALGTAGKVLVRKKFTQKQLLAFTANMETSLIGLEACAGVLCKESAHSKMANRPVMSRSLDRAHIDGGKIVLSRDLKRMTRKKH